MEGASESTPLLSTHSRADENRGPRAVESTSSIGDVSGTHSARPRNRAGRGKPRRSFTSWTSAAEENAGDQQPFCGSANNMCDSCWPKIFSVVLAAGLGGLLFGYDSSDIAIALPFIARSFKSVAASNWLKEAVVSMTTLGAAIGGFFGGFASDWYGRRSAMIGADVVFIVGALKAGSALNARELIVARFIIGTAVGLTSICGPIYIAESAPKHLRAMMVVMYNIEVGIGTVIAFVGDFAFSHTKLTWRLMLAFAAVPAFLQAIVLAFFLPETPQWLATYGRLEEAKVVSKTINYEPEDQEDEMDELVEAYEKGKYLRTEEGQKESWNVRSRPVLLQMMMGISLYLCCQVSAESAIVYYSIELFQMAGFATETALMQGIFCLGVASFLGVLSGFLAIDKLGRRRVLLFSGSGTCFSLLLLSLSFLLANVNSPPVVDGDGSSCGATDTCYGCLKAGCEFCSSPFVSGEPQPGGVCMQPEDSGVMTLEAIKGCSLDSASNTTTYLYKSGCPSGYGGFTVVALCLFQFFFQSGVGLVPAAVNAEMYPNSVRGLCNGVSVAASWACNFLVVGTFLSIASWLSPAGAFAIYGVASGSFTVFFFFALPETSGLSLAEIQDMYGIYGTSGAPPVRELHAYMVARREELAEEKMAHRGSNTGGAGGAGGGGSGVWHRGGGGGDGGAGGSSDRRMGSGFDQGGPPGGAAGAQQGLGKWSGGSASSWRSQGAGAGPSGAGAADAGAGTHGSGRGGSGS